ncbi:Myosin-binding protein 7 [Heracleum sosnowskyi]|uniref:Myosin-binding protein 7 n=1 Tax=Heracleum sosnowskyi TaxID=360622 RepID=A0AAD8J3Y4_9APIA|nr:Myosin-binding protein 7 [Heracleum sosnowskyi]
MSSEEDPSSTNLVDCPSDGGVSTQTMNRSYSGTLLGGPVRRKFHELEEGKSFPASGLDITHVAKVEISNECVALREMVAKQQQNIMDLSIELEEERNAASTAANEAMSMILRLEREKAEIEMEARQFKRFAEEKMSHDDHEIAAMEDLLYKRDQTIQSLTCEVQAYKFRMMSYGISEDEADGQKEGEKGSEKSSIKGSEKGSITRNNSAAENLDFQYEIPTYDYPPLKCNLNENQASSEVDIYTFDVEKYAFGETPRSRDHLKDLENRINQLERSPKKTQPDVDFFGTKTVLEKVIVGHSPRRSRHIRRFSTDTTNSYFVTVKETASDSASDSPKLGTAKRMDCIHSEEFSNLKKMDNASEVEDNYMSDRVYTIDSVHNVSYNDVSDPKAFIGNSEDYASTARDSVNADIADPEIKKLYLRLQALEADRESMSQALISMRTDKAQLVLLKEIAQQLCNDKSSGRGPVKKSSVNGASSFMSMCKWIVSFVLWRKKEFRSRYMSGMSPNNVGLLMLLNKGPRVGQWRCLTRTQM